MSQRKTGVFTIASKNYLAYVRVLLKSVAEIHPEYATYLCLADTVDGAFDPSAEPFEVIESRRLGIPHFEDMAVRYDIMEFNTAIKPFVFQWLLDHTDLDSVIYLDPDIRVYSRFDRLEAALASACSVVLTPHITRPIEDGKNPNDYHMLQAGVFNLGFAAINRCDDARHFVEWWGRRLQTQASVDIAHNLFTDQRWCDLAPCFVDRLHVLKCPEYNVAYWNLTERVVEQRNGRWMVNGEALAFYHFSGISVAKNSVVSKHQNRFDWDAVPDLKPLFDGYRQRVFAEGWERTQHWPYAYAKTKEGLPISTVVRQLFREHYPDSQDFQGRSASEVLVSLCNGAPNTIPADLAFPITRLMELVYRQRADLQAAFNLQSREGRAAFRAWFASAGVRECKLPPEMAPRSAQVQPDPPSAVVTAAAGAGASPGTCGAEGAASPVSESLADSGSPIAAASNPAAGPRTVEEIWRGLPATLKRLFAPALRHWLTAAAAAPVITEESSAAGPAAAGLVQGPRLGERITALSNPARLTRLLGDQRGISVLMHAIWRSRPDLRLAFDLNTPDGQSGYIGWFDAAGQREYGVGETTSGAQAPRRRAGEREAARPMPGANLVGYAHAEIGMGEHVRMSAAAFQSTPVQFGVVNFNVGVASRQEAALDHGKVASGNAYAANIFHVNADQMFVAYRHLGHNFFSNRYNIGYWAWELAKCPMEYMAAATLVDEIWAPSRFIQQAFGERADIPVEYMPLCVTLPEFPRLDRRHFGLPDRSFVFLYTFDFLSFLDRKNPFAAIRAFKLAFADRTEDVCLVLKVMHGDKESPQWRKMTELIGGDSRIRVINRTLNRDEVLALVDVCDCFVSLHRAEGFGRGPAEAMYLGKPVIVTNYSGNTDFTLVGNSCLVNYRLIAVEEGQYPFHAGQQWADADVEHAAWYMRKLFADGAYARDLGARARSHMLEHFSQRAIGAIYESRLKKLGLA